MKQVRPHILVACVLAIVLLTGTHRALQNALTDMRFGWFPREASGAIVLVAIDSPSIEKIGVWPWPRDSHAELIGQLTAAGASDIVFDVDFSSPSNPAADLAFADALQKAGGSVVLPAFKQLVPNSEGGKTIYVNRPLPEFEKNAWSAIVNVAVEADGLVRRYPYGEMLDGKFIPSVGALLAGKYDDEARALRIDFSIRAESLPTVSYIDVLRGEPAALAKLKDKKAIIGATAIELGDRFTVPDGKVIPGPALQMLAAESILQDRTLRNASVAVTLGGLCLIGFVMWLTWRRMSALTRVVVLVGVAGSAELGAMLLQAEYAIVLDTSLWHMAVAAYLAAMALDEIDFHSLLGGIAERRFHRIAMSIGDGLVCADKDGRITVWNPGAVAIFGYQPEEMIGQPLDRIRAGVEGEGPRVSLSILAGTADALDAPGGKVMEIEARRKSGETFPLEACFSAWQGVDGLQYGAVMRDITERKREAEKIKYLADHDTLTGLANRNRLYDQLGRRLAGCQTEGGKVALLMLDLDKFKQVNDTLGHACGDQLLRGVAERLSSLVDQPSLVSRLSGDEFAVILSGPNAVDRAKELADRVCTGFAKNAFTVGGRQMRINVSIGVAVYPDDCGTADELFGNADLALYRAKFNGRGRAMVFERSIREEVEARLSLEAALGLAVERNELELFYQPQVCLKDGRLSGAETLIRWRHPIRGVIPPAEFMPLVNASSISQRVSLWVLESACRQGSAWQQAGHDVRLGVNLSPSQLQSGDLAATVAAVLKKTGFSPSLLELEVTENILLEDDAMALDTFRRIQQQGVHIAFDDFGTGYASLTYLKKFPLDRMKIDQSFVRNLKADSDDAAIVGCTISLGTLLGLSVIAEGIEDAATAERLKAMGCEEGQGYFFGQPVPAAEFEQMFLNGDALAAVAPAASAA